MHIVWLSSYVKRFPPIIRRLADCRKVVTYPLRPLQGPKKTEPESGSVLLFVVSPSCDSVRGVAVELLKHDLDRTCQRIG